MVTLVILESNYQPYQQSKIKNIYIYIPHPCLTLSPGLHMQNITCATNAQFAYACSIFNLGSDIIHSLQEKAVNMGRQRT